MDGERLRALYHRLMRDPTAAAARAPRRGTHPDGLVALVFPFAALCGRSVCWACDAAHWPLWARRLALPSPSTMSRRLRTAGVLGVLAAVEAEFRGRLPRGREKVLDGKPPVVGGCGADPDAARGKVPGGWARGYRLHALVDAAAGAVEAWLVTPLDAPGEATVGGFLVDPARGVDLRGAVVRGDANFDSNDLYAAVAAAGGRLVAPPPQAGPRGLGHGRDQHPDRLAAIADLEGDPVARGGRRAAARHRLRVEQVFAHLTNVPVGLGPLPNHVRRLHRVTLWVLAKVTLYHLYLCRARARAAA